MNLTEQKRALACAVAAAQAVGKLMRQHLNSPKKINSAVKHDIKLELDVRCQKLIERILRKHFPTVTVLGEEGVWGDPASAQRWVVDPIDGTVNFTYGIPHACVSIALQTRKPQSKARGSKLSLQSSHPDAAYETLVGVVYDPFSDEMWTAIRGQRARLNGKAIQVSRRTRMSEAIVSLGFAKNKETLRQTLPVFEELVHRVRKIRIMGAAALALVYVASGRFDAYIEYGLRLWDIAAGSLILECAGGDFTFRPLPGEHAFEICANNRLLKKGIITHTRFS